jgi:tetratricopeptide (TPR) repeat protein
VAFFDGARRRERFGQIILPRALPRLERAVGICQDVDLPIFFPKMAGSLGAAYILAGRIAEAVPLLTQAMERSTAMKMVSPPVLCHLSLEEAQLLAGGLKEAHALAERALALTRAHKERGNEAYAQRLLALAEALGMRPLQAHCHRDLGTLYAMTGPQERARAELSTAIELYRAMEMTFWLPEAEAALVQVG